MHDFVLALLGGLMIGLAAVMMMATNGRIMGVSGITSQLLPPVAKDWMWRLSFIAGVLAAPVVALLLTGIQPEIEITHNLSLLIIGGLLVGVGTVVGSGCTSGHGVCGLSRFSTRSIFATAVFMIVAIVTVWVMNLLTGN